MTNLLARFGETVAGSQSKIADYISKVAPAGDFQRIENINVILNSWSNILVTPTRTYIFDPEYGSDLYKLVFDPADDETARKIDNEVRGKLEIYDDRAVIEDVEITYLNNLKGFVVTLLVNYQGDQGELSVTIDESLYFKFFDSV